MSSFKLRKIKYGFVETTTSSGTLILNKNSKQFQIFLGSSSHTLRLPDATTLKEGISFVVQNKSTGAITVQNNGLSTLGTVTAGATREFLLKDNSSSNGSWTTYTSGTAGDPGLAAYAPGAAKTADYTIQLSDDGYVIAVDTTSSDVQITLPAPSDGFNVTVKDVGGNLPQNPITIIRSSDSVKIDNEVNDDVLDTNHSSISYVSDGTDWYRISGSDNAESVALFSAGTNNLISKTEILNLESKGDSSDFGNLTTSRTQHAACASRTRGVFGGGQTSGGTGLNVMDYFEFKTEADAVDFGDLTVARRNLAACGSSTRGVFGSGIQGLSDGGAHYNTLDYITIASTGNATDFGDLNNATNGPAACSSATRGLWAGGLNSSVVTLDVIDYITIATPSNATDFGDLTVARYRGMAASNSTRGLFIGGSSFDVIDYVTIATTGNAVDFGDLTQAKNEQSAASSKTIAVVYSLNSAYVVDIEFVSFATLGNGAEWGEIGYAYVDDVSTGCSNNHGGL